MPRLPDDHANQCAFCRMMICDDCVAKEAHDCRRSQAVTLDAARLIVKAGKRAAAILVGGKLEVVRTEEDLDKFIEGMEVVDDG